MVRPTTKIKTNMDMSRKKIKKRMAYRSLIETNRIRRTSICRLETPCRRNSSHWLTTTTSPTTTSSSSNWNWIRWRTSPSHTSRASQKLWKPQRATQTASPHLISVSPLAPSKKMRKQSSRALSDQRGDLTPMALAAQVKASTLQAARTEGNRTLFHGRRRKPTWAACREDTFKTLITSN
jgi:hypothetical protein